MSKKTKSKKVKEGNTVSIHYVGTLDDGTEFDNSRNRDEVMSFEVGTNKLISGFDKALAGMKVGEVKSIKLAPDEAYGKVDPENFQTVSPSAFPPNFQLKEGLMVQGTAPGGLPVTATINSIGQDVVVLDFNHPLAGKNLNFEIELLNIQEKEN